jgi:hypothetical protein
MMAATIIEIISKIELLGHGSVLTTLCFTIMINEHNTYAFCCEDISKIENFDKAMADKT